MDDLKKEIASTLQGLLDQGGTSVSYAAMRNGRLVMADALGRLYPFCGQIRYGF